MHGIGVGLGNIFRLQYMYADDLILVLASVGDFQAMIDVCIGELDKINKKVNATNPK